LEIKPFKAVRPTRDKVSLVTSRSYDDYSPAELAAQLEFNPLSFLHVLNPAYAEAQKTGHERRFRLVRQRYEAFKQDNILRQDDKPAFYLHRIASNGNIFTGLIAAASIADYKADVIKKHEDTLEYRVRLFKEYLQISGFNTEPVLIAYPENRDVRARLEKVTASPPDFEFSTTRREMHFLWKIDDAGDVAFLRDAFGGMDTVYIADGHHRSASAEMLFDDENYTSPAKPYFMAFMIPDDDVRIYPYNRLIRDLNGLTAEQFIRRLEADFLVERTDTQRAPQKRHQFSMCLRGESYLLSLASDPDYATPLNRLDAQILYEKILRPVLGIEDLRNDDRIEYVSGKFPMQGLTGRVDDGEFDLAFFLHPAGMAEVRDIADAGQVMPPKSTFIEPKFRSGLVIYEM
jgi:uncharacterized protein (DUF1015 family)